MRNKHTQLVIVLDRSGSMGNIAEATITAYNEFVASQKAVEGTADIYLAQFDDKYDVLYDGSLQDAPLLTDKTFVPRGMTALNDGIGRTMQSVGNKLANLPEHQRAEKVIVAIFTDGGENSSKEYKREQVAAMIKEQETKYGWQVNFFGANQDAVLVGKSYNVQANNAYTYSANEASARNTMSFMSGKVSLTRSVNIRPSEFVVPAKFDKAMRAAAMSNKAVSKEDIENLIK
jgi:hypothetical protein